MKLRNFFKPFFLIPMILAALFVLLSTQLHAGEGTPSQFNEPAYQTTETATYNTAIDGTCESYSRGSGFKDVPKDHSFCKYIKFLKQNYITEGCEPENKKYCPKRLLSRAELALMLARAVYGVNDDNDLPYPLNPLNRRFSDSNNDKFGKAVENLAIDGIVGHDQDDDRFEYDKLITRADIADMVVRALGLDIPEIPPSVLLTDIQGHEREGAIVVAYEYEIIHGYSDNTFRPDKPATRAEIAKFLCRGLLLGGCSKDEGRDGTRNWANKLREDRWEYVGPGIKMKQAVDQSITIATASKKDPVKVQLANDGHNPPFQSGRGTQFERKILSQLMSINSGAGLPQEQNSMFLRFRPSIAINGTGFECDGRNSIYEGDEDNEDDDRDTSTLYIERTEYGTHLASSFFTYTYDEDERLGEGKIYAVYDPSNPQSTGGDFEMGDREFIESKATAENTDFAVSYDYSTLLYNGEHVGGNETNGERKTAIGTSDDGTIFIATVSDKISSSQLANKLKDAGATDAILLDNGGSTQFLSFGANGAKSDTRGSGPLNPIKCPIDGTRLKEPRYIINGIVIYHELITKVKSTTVFSSRTASMPSVGTTPVAELKSRDGTTISFVDEPFFPPSSSEPSPVTVHYVPQPVTSTFPLANVGHFFVVEAAYEDGEPAIPQKPYTMTVIYDHYMVPSTINENDLSLHFWNGSEWEKEPTSQVYSNENKIIATPTTFGFWAILGPPVKDYCLPVPLDFEFDTTGNLLLAGTSFGEQWSELGIHVSGVGRSGRPNQVILFDSGNPTANDWDLGTPNEAFGGPGVGVGGAEGPGENSEGQGLVLILPENLTDADGDGLVDEPNDSAMGGDIYFDFDYPFRVDSIKMVDLDGDENDNYVEVFDIDGNLIKTVHISPLGNNSYQEVSINEINVGSLHIFLSGSGAISEITFCNENQPPPTCELVAVYDRNADDSQFFTVDYAAMTSPINSLGVEQLGADIEGLDFDPNSRELFASAAQPSSGQASKLYQINSFRGYTSFVETIRDASGNGFVEVSSLAFHPDGTLWGFARGGASERRGLIQIDPKTAVATLIYSSTLDVEGLAWTPDGDLLWLSSGKDLYTYTPEGNIEFAFTATELPGDMEGLEFRPDGLLLAGIHHGDGLNIYALDVQTGQIVLADSFETDEFNDVESLAWPEWCTDSNIPTPTTVAPGEDAFLDHTDSYGMGASFSMPADAITEPTTFSYVEIDSAETVPDDLVSVAAPFRLNAYRNGTHLPNFVFSEPITVTISYATSDLADVNEEALELRYWDGDSWDNAACGPVMHDLVQNQISVPICHLTEFGLFENRGALAVNLAFFDASAHDNHILIEWQTVSELSNLGFNLYRSSDAQILGQPLNSALISSQVPGSGQGFLYDWRDEEVESGHTYYYTLEDIDVDGNRTLHGPISATVNVPSSITVDRLGSMSHSSVLWALAPMLAMLAALLIARRRRASR